MSVGKKRHVVHHSRDKSNAARWRESVHNVQRFDKVAKWLAMTENGCVWLYAARVRPAVIRCQLAARLRETARLGESKGEMKKKKWKKRKEINKMLLFWNHFFSLDFMTYCVLPPLSMNLCSRIPIRERSGGWSHKGWAPQETCTPLRMCCHTDTQDAAGTQGKWRESRNKANLFITTYLTFHIL